MDLLEWRREIYSTLTTRSFRRMNGTLPSGTRGPFLPRVPPTQEGTNNGR